MTENDIPNPGSVEAIDEGCTCPSLDNWHGRGYHGIEGQFATRPDCPLHGEGL